jgi:acetyl esterase/lipase
MEEAKVHHLLKEWPGACHGFLQMTRDVALAREAIADAATFFARTL